MNINVKSINKRRLKCCNREINEDEKIQTKLDLLLKLCIHVGARARINVANSAA